MKLEWHTLHLRQLSEPRRQGVVSQSASPLSSLEDIRDPLQRLERIAIAHELWLDELQG
jgi:hypothetical protein